MRTERLVYTYTDSSIILLLQKRLSVARDVYLPLKEIYSNGILQSNSYIFSSEVGGYYHVKFSLSFSINTLLTLADTTVAILLNSYLNSQYKGNIGRVELNLDSSGVVTNTSALTQVYDFELYLEKGSHLNIAFQHEIDKSISLTISSVAIEIYEITDKKETTPDTLVSLSQLEGILQNYMQKTSYTNPDGTIGIQKDIEFNKLKGIPAQFPAKEHQHPDLLSEVDFYSFRDKLISNLSEIRSTLHEHENLDVLNGFYTEGQLLYFKGKRFMNYQDYLGNIPQADLWEILREISDLHYDVLGTFEPEDYFYDLGNHLRWEANREQYLYEGQWSTLMFDDSEQIKGDLAHVIHNPGFDDWRFYPQVAGLYTVSFYYILDFSAAGYAPGDIITMNFSLFKNEVQYSVLDFEWLEATPIQLDLMSHFRFSFRGIDRINMRLGDYFNIKVKHTFDGGIQPPLELSYGYINIERSDTYGRDNENPNIPPEFQ